MTVRVDPALLAALKKHAARQGRSVSAEVLRLIQRDIAPEPARPRKRIATMGMYADFEAPTLREFKRVRRRASARMLGLPHPPRK